MRWTAGDAARRQPCAMHRLPHPLVRAPRGAGAPAVERGPDGILARLETRAARPRLAGGTEAGLPRPTAEPVAPVATPDETLRSGPADEDAPLAARTAPDPLPGAEPAAPAAPEPAEDGRRTRFMMRRHPPPRP